MLNVDNAFVGVCLSYCHSVTVSSVRYTKLCVDGQPSEHCLWHTLMWCCLDDRRWTRAIVMTSDITRYEYRTC